MVTDIMQVNQILSLQIEVVKLLRDAPQNICRLTVDQQSVDSRPTNDVQTVDRRPTVG